MAARTMLTLTVVSHCKARLKASELPPPAFISLSSLKVDKTAVSDNDIVSLSFLPSGDCDYIVNATSSAAPSSVQKVIARGSAEERRLQVVSIAAKSLFVGDNTLIVTVLGSDTTVATYSVVLTFTPTQAAVSIQTAPGGCAAPFAEERVNGASAISLFAVLCSRGGVYVGPASAATSWALSNAAMGVLAPATGSATVFTAGNTSATGSISAQDPNYPAGIVRNVTIVPVSIAINDCLTPLLSAQVRTGKTLVLNALKCDATGQTLGAIEVRWSTGSALGTFTPAVGSTALFQAATANVGSDTLQAVAAPYTTATAALMVDWAVHQWTTNQIVMNAAWTPDGQNGPKGTLTSTRITQPAVINLDFYESGAAADLTKAQDLTDGYAVYHPDRPTQALGVLTQSNVTLNNFSAAFVPYCPANEQTEQEHEIYNVYEWWSVNASLSGAAGGRVGFVGKSSLVRGTDGGETNKPSVFVGSTENIHDLVLRNPLRTDPNDKLQGPAAVAQLTVPLNGTYTLSNVSARRMTAGGDQSNPDAIADLRSAEFRIFFDPLLPPLCVETTQPDLSAPPDPNWPCRAARVDVTVGDPQERFNFVRWSLPANPAPFHLNAGQNIYLVSTRRDVCSASYDVTAVTADITVVVD